MPVYMIRAGIAGDVKIGMAADPLKRMQGLQTSNTARLHMIRVLEGERETEKTLHARFAAQRKAGEWFSFVPEMLAKDIGYADLPIPRRKRDIANLDTPMGRRRAVHDDIVHALGGADAIARRLGVAPWVAVGWDGDVKPNFFSAVALMMRDAGYRHVTVQLLLQIQDEQRDYDQEEAEKRADADAARAQVWEDERNARAEVEWLKRNSAAAAWWELLPENRTAVVTEALADITPPVAEAA